MEQKCLEINAINYATAWGVYFYVQSNSQDSNNIKHQDFLPYNVGKEKTLLDSMTPKTIDILHRLWKEEKIPMKVLMALNKNGIMLNNVKSATNPKDELEGRNLFM